LARDEERGVIDGYIVSASEHRYPNGMVDYFDAPGLSRIVVPQKGTFTVDFNTNSIVHNAPDGRKTTYTNIYAASQGLAADAIPGLPGYYGKFVESVLVTPKDAYGNEKKTYFNAAGKQVNQEIYTNGKLTQRKTFDPSTGELSKLEIHLFGLVSTYEFNKDLPNVSFFGKGRLASEERHDGTDPAIVTQRTVYNYQSSSSRDLQDVVTEKFDKQGKFVSTQKDVYEKGRVVRSELTLADGTKRELFYDTSGRLTKSDSYQFLNGQSVKVQSTYFADSGNQKQTLNVNWQSKTASLSTSYSYGSSKYETVTSWSDLEVNSSVGTSIAFFAGENFKGKLTGTISTHTTPWGAYQYQYDGSGRPIKYMNLRTGQTWYKKGNIWVYSPRLV
jgi:YD repeat-containing protein